MVWASSAARFAQLLWLQRTRRCLCSDEEVEQETLLQVRVDFRYSFFILHLKREAAIY